MLDVGAPSTLVEELQKKLAGGQDDPEVFAAVKQHVYATLKLSSFQQFLYRCVLGGRQVGIVEVSV